MAFFEEERPYQHAFHGIEFQCYPDCTPEVGPPARQAQDFKHRPNQT